jgi:hypothetical protein
MSRMFVASLVLSLISGGLRSASADDISLNQLTPEEAKAGWKLLFDGKSTDGWRNYKAEGVKDQWKIVDGALTMTEKGGGDIITKDQYGAFELTLEYNISPGGNSGIMYHVRETADRPWQTGPEIQVQDNAAGHDPQKAGWLYQFYKSDVDATKPAGQWNQLRIVISPKKCEHYMNGVKYCEYVIGSDDWNEKLAASKFSKFPEFAKYDAGFICLQDHGNLVSYRNIKIRKLDDQGNPVAGGQATSRRAVQRRTNLVQRLEQAARRVRSRVF